MSHLMEKNFTFYHKHMRTLINTHTNILFTLYEYIYIYTYNILITEHVVIINTI